MSKKLEEKQRKRLAEERRRAEQRKAALRRNALTIGVAVGVAVLVVVAIILQRSSEQGAAENVGVGEQAAGCGPIEEFESSGRGHIGVGAPHEPYNSDPPTSGPHYEVPADAGFFTEQLPPEQLVHNLEHGQIVIWYAPDVPESTIEQLQALVDQEPVANLAAPYQNIEDPYNLVLTAWGASQPCEQVSQAVVDDFRRRFQGKGPEPIAPAFEG